MATLPNDPRPFGASVATFLRRNCLWLLIGCYALAAIVPDPGRAMRTWQWNLPNGPEAAVTLPLLMLTLLLFCAALLADVPQIRAVAVRPWALLAGVLSVWIGPALLVVAAAAVVPRLIEAEAAAGVLIGLALVASMPVANSSVGWTQMARGNLALGLALVLLTIFICPWVTPSLLGTFRLSLSPPDQANLQTLVDNFSGTFFIVWVILPTVAGITCRYLLGQRRIAAAVPAATIASVTALLMLNYVNAALALPKVIDQSQWSVFGVTAIVSLALSLVGLAVAWLIARLLRLSSEDRSALFFGLSMKHTGLALLLAGAVLADQPLAILTIVLATLAQHMAAAVVEWRQTA